MVEVEVFQRLPRREPGGLDPALTAVGFPGGDLPLQARGKEFLVGPVLGAARSANRDTAPASVGAFNARVR